MAKQPTRETGAALLMALLGLVVLTLLGIATMSDVTTQSVMVRNEQFRQRVFYAANSELNAQIAQVNGNPSSVDDALITNLLDSNWNPRDLSLSIGNAANPLVTAPETVALTDVAIRARSNPNAPCPGEGVGDVRVLSGRLEATATMQNNAIRSTQHQRFVYCWP